MLKLNTILGSDIEAYFHDDWLKKKSHNSEIDFKTQNCDFISQNHKFISCNSEKKKKYKIARKKGGNFSELWDIGLDLQFWGIMSESQKR